MIELAEFVRACYDVESTVVEVCGHDVSEYADRAFIAVFKIGRVLVQVLGMSTHGFFVKALAIAKEFNVWAQDGLDDVEGLCVKG